MESFRSGLLSFLRTATFLAAFCCACLLSTLRAQDTESDNPTGPSGSFNGEVTTAGSYDPLTGNIKRRVTDLTVPGSNGAYPLTLSRTFNSNLAVVAGDTGGFGDGGNWRHSYQWALSVGSFNNYNGNVTAYTVAYPDGSVITFRPGRNSAPVSETANYNYWRGPSGTTDRLEVNSSTGNCLHTADGGLVNFGSAGHPSTIVDPNGAVTKLDYQPNNAAYLAKVTEPGGRWLSFTYTTYNYHAVQNGFNVNHSWTLLTQVQASTGQTVTYTEVQQGSHELGGSQIGTVPYYVLTDVSYNYEASVAPGGGNVHASYSYDTSVVPPAFLTATDPHYAGAMINIRYTGGYGNASLEEQNLGTSERVSHLDISVGSTSTTSTETRGDKSSGTGNTSGSGAFLTRTFSYGTQNPTVPGDSTAPPKGKQGLLGSVTDFEGHISYRNYYDVTAKDSNGKSFLASSVDAKGNPTRYQHEPLTGKTNLTTLPDGRTRSALWLGADDSNTSMPYYLYQTTDERGQTTTYHHASNTGLVQQIDYPDGSHEFYNYKPVPTSNGTFYKVSLYQNKLGGQITYGYDEANHGGSGFLGLLTSVTRSYYSPVDGSHAETTNFYYDGLDRVNKSVDQRGITTTFEYNPRHQLAKITHAADNTSVVYGYDDYGNRTSVQDELLHTATTVYDEYRRVYYTLVPVNAPMADGTQIASRYVAFAYERRDNSNNLVGDAFSHTGSNWSVTWMPDGSASRRVYSPNNWLTDQYDGMYVNGGQTPVVASPWSGYVHLSSTYSAIGQIKTATDAQGFVTTYNYDNCNRLSSLTDPAGHQTVSTYYGPGDHCALGAQLDCSGLLKSVQSPGPDAVNNPTVTTSCNNYDAMSRALQTDAPSNNSGAVTTPFQSGFDAGGNLTSQTDGIQTSGQHNTGYAYDQLGRKARITYPVSNATEQWIYDASGNVKTFKNRAGKTCTYQYDLRNRCTGYGWDDGITQSVAYEYDAASRVTRVVNSSADIHFTYDDSGALRKETEVPVGQTAVLATKYSHDLEGNVDSITYPNTNYPCFSYDAQHRCTGMYSGGATFSHYNFYANWLTGRSLANGLYTAYGYQNNGRVSSVWHYHGDSAGNQSTNGSIRLSAYGYAPNGQVSWFDREADGGQSGSSLENGRGDEFKYWADGSLCYGARDIAVTSGWPGKYSATADSRVDDSTVSYAGASASTYGFEYLYDAAGNRTHATQLGQPGFPYQPDGQNKYGGSSYDDNGNTTSFAAGWTYNYDAENKLTSASASGQSLACYYDGLGRLVAQNVNGVASYFYYAGSQRIEERNASNQLVYLFFYDAPGSDQILFRQGPQGVHWYQSDALGNTTHLSGNTGTVVEQYLYDPYGMPTVYDAAGNVRAGGSAYDNHYLFKSVGGYVWIPEAGLYYARARFYLPQHGRWLQPDPIGQAGGLNIYAYCGNDPVNGIDPSGLDGFDEFETGKKYSYTGDNGGTYTGYKDNGGNWVDTTNTDIRGTNAPAPGKVAWLTDTARAGDAGFSQSSGAVSRGGWSSSEPGLVESFVPVLGNAHSSYYNFANGHPWKGAFYAGMAASDVFLAKTLVVGAAKGLAMAGGRLVAKEVAAEGVGEVTTVIGRVKDLQELGAGERSLLDRLTPDLGSPQANWYRNSGVLRQEINRGLPIRDASPGNMGGQFLNAERNLLRNKGWTFDSNTNFWNPPNG